MEDINQPEPDNSPEKSNSDVAQFTEIIKEFLKEINLKELADSFNNVKIEKTKADQTRELENIKSRDLANNLNLKFWKYKFAKDVAVIVIIIFSLCYLSYLDKVNSQIVGTLLGSIIGYSVGNFNSSRKN